MAIKYELLKTHGKARAGKITTPHGEVETPVFMPVGTQSTVKAITFEQLDSCGTEIVLANTYHLYLRPGGDLIDKFGGLHGWTSYKKPFLTDSGGFQIFSQGKINKCKVTDEGAHFVDHIRGDKHFIGPKEATEIQNKLGADIMMAFDHCPEGKASYEDVLDATERTHRWAKLCQEAHQRKEDQALFLIVQGGIYKDLRKMSVDELTKLDAPGYAIGGVSVGEEREDIDAIVEYTAPLLPENKPRYLMGVGTKEDIVKAIASGVDMFDCVMPTRIARHGAFFTKNGNELIKASKFESDEKPLIEGCKCYTCRNHSRAYLRHLFRSGEAVAGTLLSMHNLSYLIGLTKEIREAILNSTFDPQDYLN